MKKKETLSWLKGTIIALVAMGGHASLASSPAPWEFEFKEDEVAVGAEAVFEKSISAYEEGNPERAYEILNGWSGRNDSREAMFWRAWYAGEAGLIDEAESIYRDLMGEDPTNPWYQNALGYLLVENRYGRVGEAVRLLFGALEIAPDEPAIRHSYGAALAARGFFKRAGKHYEIAVELLEGDFDAQILSAYGRILISLGEDSEFSDLLEHIQSFEDERGFAPPSYYNLKSRYALYKNEADEEMLDFWRTGAAEFPAAVFPAIVHALMLHVSGDDAAARKEMKRSGELIDESSDFFSTYAAALLEIGMTREAAQAIRILIKAEPDNARYHARLGYVLAGDGRSLDEAIDRLEKALELDPDRPSFISYYAWALYNKGQPAAAAVLARQALNSDGGLTAEGRVAALVEYGQILWSLGHEDDAIEEWREAWEKNSNQREVLEILDQYDLAFKETSDEEENFEYYESVLVQAEELNSEEGPEEAYRFLAAMDLVGLGSEEILYAAAYYAEAADLIEEAEDIYRVLMVLNPEDGRSYDKLGYLLTTRSERFVEARFILEKALELSPEDPSVIDSLGWILYKQGYLERASEKLEEASRLASAGDSVHLHVSILAHYGEVLWESNMPEEAIDVWASAWQLNSTYELENEILLQTLVRYAEERNKYPGFPRETADQNPGVLR